MWQKEGRVRWVWHKEGVGKVGVAQVGAWVRWVWHKEGHR